MVATRCFSWQASKAFALIQLNIITKASKEGKPKQVTCNNDVCTALLCKSMHLRSIHAMRSHASKVCWIAETLQNNTASFFSMVIQKEMLPRLVIPNVLHSTYDVGGNSLLKGV